MSEWVVLHDWRPGDKFLVPGPQGWRGEVLRMNAWQFLVKVDCLDKAFLLDDWSMDYMEYLPVEQIESNSIRSVLNGDDRD